VSLPAFQKATKLMTAVVVGLELAD
jgi:hypothetical protein